MIVVSLHTIKGGVAKTTLTANLGADLARRGMKVLLVDLDLQGSLALQFYSADGWQEYDRSGRRTIKRWFDSFQRGDAVDLDDLVLEPPSLGSDLAPKGGVLGLIPADAALAEAESLLEAELRPDARDSLSPESFVEIHSRLLRGLQDKRISERYDVVLIDCHPDFKPLARNAVVASRFVVVPVRADLNSAYGVRQSVAVLREFRSRYNRALTQISARPAPYEPMQAELLGIIPVMINYKYGRPDSTARGAVHHLRGLGEPMFNTTIGDSKKLINDSVQNRRPAVLQKRQVSRVVGELRDFADEFCDRLGLMPDG